MIDLDQKLHRSLVALADARPVTTPPVASIVTTATTRAARPRRPRRVVIAAVAGGLTLGVSGAALAGVLPGPVMSAFDRVSGWGGPCRIDRQDTRLVASTRTPGGSTLEWWASSTATSHEIDDYWRTVASDGTTHGIAESCEPRGIRDTSFFCCSGQTSATETDFWGEAPDGTASLHVVLSDGSTVAVALQDGRYFIASFAAGAGAPRPTTIVARDLAGTVLDEQAVRV